MYLSHLYRLWGLIPRISTSSNSPKLILGFDSRVLQIPTVAQQRCLNPGLLVIFSLSLSSAFTIFVSSSESYCTITRPSNRCRGAVLRPGCVRVMYGHLLRAKCVAIRQRCCGRFLPQNSPVRIKTGRATFVLPSSRAVF
jgi:hypothetical protein